MEISASHKQAVQDLTEMDKVIKTVSYQVHQKIDLEFIENSIIKLIIKRYARIAIVMIMLAIKVMILIKID